MWPEAIKEWEEQNIRASGTFPTTLYDIIAESSARAILGDTQNRSPYTPARYKLEVLRGNLHNESIVSVCAVTNLMTLCQLEII